MSASSPRRGRRPTCRRSTGWGNSTRSRAGPTTGRGWTRSYSASAPTTSASPAWSRNAPCRATAGRASNGRWRRGWPRSALATDELADAFAEAAPATPVLITEYFDPTHDEFGRFCKDGPGLTTDAEAQWAYEELLRPLNRQIRTAADVNGWQPIGGIAADFEHHGYCARERRWVRTLPEALATDNPAGTLHPNEEGHKAIARRVAGPLAALLDFQAPVPPPEAEADEGLPSLGEIGTGVATAVFAPQLAIAAKLLEPDLDSTWRQILAFWLLLPLLIALAWLVWRALMLLRATWPPDPAGDRKPPRLRRDGRSSSRSASCC